MIKRLQVYKDDSWQYVFCYSVTQGIVTTKNKKIALLQRDLEFFRGKFSNHEFRVI
jgi:hypothetical protein